MTGKGSISQLQEDTRKYHPVIGGNGKERGYPEFFLCRPDTQNRTSLILKGA